MAARELSQDDLDRIGQKGRGDPRPLRELRPGIVRGPQRGVWSWRRDGPEGAHAVPGNCT
jgi:hypothetical protein